MPQLIITMDPAFPLDDVEEIGRRLMRSGSLIAGWIPPAAGMLDIGALLAAEHLDGFQIVVMPDRNVASRMARVALGEEVRLSDPPTGLAVQLMAFAQAANIDLDPGVAFHELAHRDGREALEELAWFRTADAANAHAWIDLALGRADRAEFGGAAPLERHDVSEPPARWLRNYVAALKMFELELLGGGHVERVEALLDWMIEDFILAGPAALYAMRAFATRDRRGGMMKHVRSPDRQRAVAGARNAAWDVTYLSEFVRRIPPGEKEGRRFIFATADRGLADVARLVLLGAEPTEDLPSLEQALTDWWHPRDARRIARRLFRCIEEVSVWPPPGAGLQDDPLPEMIAAGERRLMESR